MTVLVSPDARRRATAVALAAAAALGLTACGSTPAPTASDSGPASPSDVGATASPAAAASSALVVVPAFSGVDEAGLALEGADPQRAADAHAFLAAAEASEQAVFQEKEDAARDRLFGPDPVTYAEYAALRPRSDHTHDPAVMAEFRGVREVTGTVAVTEGTAVTLIPECPRGVTVPNAHVTATVDGEEIGWASGSCGGFLAGLPAAEEPGTWTLTLTVSEDVPVLLVVTEDLP